MFNLIHGLNIPEYYKASVQDAHERISSLPRLGINGKPIEDLKANLKEFEAISKEIKQSIQKIQDRAIQVSVKGVQGMKVQYWTLFVCFLITVGSLGFAYYTNSQKDQAIKSAVEKSGEDWKVGELVRYFKATNQYPKTWQTFEETNPEDAQVLEPYR